MISNFLFSKLWRAYLNAFYISPVIHGEKIAAAPRIHSPTIHNLDYIWSFIWSRLKFTTLNK